MYVFKPHINSSVRIFSVGIQPDVSGGIQHTCYDITGFWSRLHTKDSQNIFPKSNCPKTPHAFQTSQDMSGPRPPRVPEIR